MHCPRQRPHRADALVVCTNNYVATALAQTIAFLLADGTSGFATGSRDVAMTSIEEVAAPAQYTETVLAVPSAVLVDHSESTRLLTLAYSIDASSAEHTCAVTARWSWSVLSAFGSTARPCGPWAFAA